MKNNHEKKQAEILYDQLFGKKQPDIEGKLTEEYLLAERMKQTIEASPVNAAYQKKLEQSLETLAGEGVRKRQSSKIRRGNLLIVNKKVGPVMRAIAYAAIGVVLILILGWSIRNLLPNAPASAPTQEPSPTVTSSLEPTMEATIEATASSSIETKSTSTPEPMVVNLPMIPGVEILMSALIPESPEKVPLYVQEGDSELTIENAKEIARRLGVNGSVYLGGSEAPQQTVYIILEGGKSIYFLNSPTRFHYSSGKLNPHEPQTNNLTSEEMGTIAESFLNDAGLLPDSYQVEFPDNRQNTVVFTPLLDGIPILMSVMDPPFISVIVDAQGQITDIDYQSISYQKLEEYPIRSAQEAWDKLVNEEIPSGAEQSTSYTAQPYLEWWNRIVPVGVEMDFYGYVVEYRPAEVGISPRISLGNYTLTGNLNGITEAVNPGTFIQVRGKLVDEFTLEVVNWQVSPYADENLVGRLERTDGKVYFVNGEDRLLMNEIPEEAPTDQEVRLRGVRLPLDEPTFEWSYLETGDIPAQGGGGGGGSVFAQVVLDGSGGLEAQPTSVPNPQVAAGTPVEAMEGTLTVQINKYPDGSEEKITSIYLGDQNILPGVWELRLEGEGLAGIEAYQTLPVRIWGKITAYLQETTVVVNVERYEPVYPGLSVQAWLGTWEVKTLEGKQVILFTAQDGQQYVLKSSIDYDPDEFIGYPGDLTILEGVQYPDQTFGGFPVVEERAGGMTEGLTDLSNYEITSNQVWVNEQAAPQTGKVRIEVVELVYRANDMKFGPYDPASGPLYIQPVWRFFGHYEDGRVLEILVQALRDEYLK